MQKLNKITKGNRMSKNDEIYENNESDEQFFERADEFINLANQLIDSTHQVSHLTTEPGKVSASFMYANARFSAWHAACSYQHVDDFKKDRQVILDYYVEQFKSMLESNLDEYEENFEAYFPKADPEEVKRFV